MGQQLQTFAESVGGPREAWEITTCPKIVQLAVHVTHTIKERAFAGLIGAVDGGRRTEKPKLCPVACFCGDVCAWLASESSWQEDSFSYSWVATSPRRHSRDVRLANPESQCPAASSLFSERLSLVLVACLTQLRLQKSPHQALLLLAGGRARAEASRLQLSSYLPIAGYPEAHLRRSAFCWAWCCLDFGLCLHVVSVLLLACMWRGDKRVLCAASNV